MADVIGGLLNENITLQSTPSSIVRWQGGEGIVIMEGTWNGATMTLQVRSSAAGAFVSMGSDAALDADGVVAFVASSGSDLRVEASVADPTGVEVSILAV
jgi:hypothetical protein